MDKLSMKVDSSVGGSSNSVEVGAANVNCAADFFCTSQDFSTAAVPATATLLYTVGKDSSTPILRKGPSIQNLDNNREMLERELQKLLAVATDIDKKEEIKNTSTCKLWITRVWEIQAEVEALIQEHEGIKEKFRREINIVAKGRLSQKMVNKLEEVIQHLEEGKFMIANFQRDY
ncbi:hypothetical protein GH714_025033 [Hevea brasiliensis]|uniref:Uncharacterized protein n=1 Tax=Hevea brasiliensis TaxID=3981 RepID=A0A6A6N7K6_HEVBR|nr:hypothetical protein GH714_025033 [Hevea brasiliensis]